MFKNFLKKTKKKIITTKRLIIVPPIPQRQNNSTQNPFKNITFKHIERNFIDFNNNIQLLNLYHLYFFQN